MTSCVGCHYQPTLWDALWTCARPRKLTLLASSFGAKVFPSPNVRVWFWYGLMQKSSICPCHLTTPLVHLLCSWCNLLKVFNLYFTCNLMWYICVIPCRTRKKVMSSLHPMFLLFFYRSIVEFFYGFLGMFHIWPKMLLLDGILSTWPSTLALAPLIALTWTQPPFQILVHYEWGRVGALSCALD